MENSMLAIGIDIGWSERHRSCAFAALDPLQKLTWPDRVDRYGTVEIGCCRFRKSELVEFIRSLSEVMRQYEKLIIVLDGPLGPSGQPRNNRDIDSFFRRGQFRNRMQPSDVENDAGQTYVNATYEIAHAFSDVFNLWMGGDKDRLLVTETNPTVGLALMNKKFCPDQLPSRKRPLVPPSEDKGEAAIRAKSDFYWHAGAKQVCSEILQCPKIALEKHHENVAALYCLTVAAEIRGGRELVMGRTNDGVYVFPNQIHSDWHNDLEKSRIVAGKVSDLPESTHAYDYSLWKRRPVAERYNENSEATSMECESDMIEACNDDSTILILNDNGGVHEKHNAWLDGAHEPVRIRLVEQDRTASLQRFANHTNSRQWKIKCDGTKLKAHGIAKLYGLDVAHLSNKEHIAIEVEIVSVGE